MNKTKIEWADYTWNPVTGCLHGCEYCYAHKIANRFSGDIRCNMKDSRLKKEGNGLYEIDEAFTDESSRAIAYPCGFNPTFHKYQLNKPGKLKHASNIFVCSMADMFGGWVPDEWIMRIFEVCKNNPTHSYLFLTKNPKRYRQLYHDDMLPEEKNFWYGTTITSPDDFYIDSIRHNCFLSIEPLLKPFKSGSLDLHLLDWIIIGAETGSRKGKVVPKKDWVDAIIEDCKRFKVPVFMKDSLINIVGKENMRRELPEELKITSQKEAEKNKRLYCEGC